ncbi:hypothetical protein ABI214_13375 [Prescottella soli]|uniref:Mycothiol-dependent maleylpyruvate isomerase metal-binding domain-containing protein n=1 Tax=Prescottella soli TaxID=1543852 RepID=A0ABW9FX98_9NOCA
MTIDELVVHAWDLARATGQPFESDPASVEAGREGLYGPVIPIPADAPDLDRLLGYAGRDPRWAPAEQVVGG